MKLETVDIAKLKPLEQNVRRHSDRQIEEFAKSLKQFGQIRPFVIDEDGTVLVGNGMLEAMKLAGMKKCSAYRVKGLSEVQKKKLVLTDNKIYSLGSDNLENIEAFLQDLADAGDFDVPGFDEETMRALTMTASEVLDDAMSYGLTDNIKQPKQQPQQPQQVQESGASVEEESTEPEQETAQEEQPHTVICPSCGEVIRL